MQKVEGSDPAGRCGNTPYLLACQDLGVRHRDTTVSFCIGSGFVPETAAESALAAARRVGLNSPARDLEDLARALALASPMWTEEPTLIGKVLGRSNSQASFTQ
jgi:hypothetical protein